MPGEFSSSSVRQQLDRIPASAGFSRNERLSQFLRFVVERRLEGREAELKESVLATEVFGRSPVYDPKLDAIVRTEAIRLRARLAKYYEEEGKADPLVLELPKGGYVPLFRLSAAPDPLPPVATKLWFSAAVVAAILILAGAVWWWTQSEHPPVAIAVLPLDNLSHNPAEDYFSDGLTDEIIRNLSMIDGLAVRSRTSSFGLKDKPRNVRETGKQLGVDYLLEGSVLRSGEKLRINTQLIRVEDDFPVWTGKFDRSLPDIFAIQDEISLGIVNGLRLKLSLGRRRYETSVEAYDLYLRTRAGERVISPGMLADDRIHALEAVIAKDPSFAPAYGNLASLYAVRSIQFPLDHPPDELPKMRAMADKALQLDPLLAETHVAIGLVHARAAQWRDAEASFRKAIELDPNNSSTYVNFVMWYLHVLGRNEEGAKLLQHAAQLDPLAADIRAALAESLISMSRFEEAGKHCAMLPSSDRSKVRCLARVQLAAGKISEARTLLEKDPGIISQPMARGTLGYTYALTGQHDQAEKLAAAAKLPNEQALIFAGFRDKDRTLDALNRMSYVGAQRIGMFLGYPEMAFLQGDPRVTVLRRKVGLPD